MTESVDSEYWCDKKYENIIIELEKRRWKLLCDCDTIPSSCHLLWKNLSKIDWGSVFDRFVNHVKGSQHMSNKAYLAYHLDGTNQSKILPPSWSSSYQSIEDLVSMVAMEELLCSIGSIRNMDADIDDMKRLKTMHGHIFTTLFNGNSPWKNSHVSTMHHQVLDIFGQCLNDDRSCVDVSEAISTRCSLIEAEVSQWRRLSPSGGHNSRGLWIVKPVAQACGRDISVVRRIETLLNTVAAMHFTCVVQKYIERPLLVRGCKKFDIRQWVLVTSVNPLIIYGFSECYLRLSGRPFSLEDNALDDVNVHLCNHTVNKSFEGLDSDNGSSPQSATMMTQSEFEEALETGQIGLMDYEACCGTSESDRVGDGSSRCGTLFRRKILPQIRNASVIAVQSCREKFTKVGRGFEWLGVDLIVTDTGEVFVLEVNISPDTSASTIITSRLVEAATRDLFDMLLVDKVADSAVAAMTAAERAYCSGSGRWNRQLGVLGDGAADIISRSRLPTSDSTSASSMDSGTDGIVSADSISDEKDDVVSSCLMWQLWHVGRQESKSELNRIASRKIDKLGVLKLNLAPTAAIGAERVQEYERAMQLVSIICDIICRKDVKADVAEENVVDAINHSKQDSESDDEM